MFPSVTFLYVSFCTHYVSSLHDSRTPQFCTSPYLLISSLMFSVPLVSRPDLSEHLVYIFLEPVLDTPELILLGLTHTLPRFPWTLSFRLGSGCLSLLFSSPVFPTRVPVWTVDSCLLDSSLHLFSVHSDPTGSKCNTELPHCTVVMSRDETRWVEMRWEVTTLCGKTKGRVANEGECFPIVKSD